MKEKLKKLSGILITVIFTLLAVFLAVVVVLSRYNLPFEKLLKVVSVISSSYVGEFDIEKCEENAINAVIETIGDKYAVYYDEKNAAEMMQMIEGHYIGIGIEIFANIEKGYIEVLSAYEDSPAERAGIISGDFIKAIDGKEYPAKDMADAVSYMKGINIESPLEKDILITLLRDGKEINVVLKREKIELYKVTSEVIDDICYIRYSGYTKESFLKLKEIIDGIEDGVNGVVIDIRNNPGGEFKSAIEMCDLFLENEMIMYTLDKDMHKTCYNAKEGSCTLPLAVIVNESTASAAEIFAGAMQANDRAVIVGKKTYGKGVTQTVRYLNSFDTSEGAIKLTTEKNYTSDGRWINESIVPDIETEATMIKDGVRNDAAFKAAVKYLKEEK